MTKKQVYEFIEGLRSEKVSALKKGKEEAIKFTQAQVTETHLGKLMEEHKKAIEALVSVPTVRTKLGEVARTLDKVYHSACGHSYFSVNTIDKHSSEAIKAIANGISFLKIYVQDSWYVPEVKQAEVIYDEEIKLIDSEFNKLVAYLKTFKTAEKAVEYLESVGIEIPIEVKITEMLPAPIINFNLIK